jgi:hypothetical protein
MQHSRLSTNKAELIDNTVAPPRTRELALVVDPRDGGSLNFVEVWLYDNGNHVATLARFKMTDSGGRVAADFPGCDGNYVITDANGHITNG